MLDSSPVLRSSTSERNAPKLGTTLRVPKAVEALLDAGVFLIWLVAVAAWFGEAIDARLAVAAVLGFALTYPGNVALTDTTSETLRKSIVTAITILAGLALYSYASGWLHWAPRRQLLPWFAFLPAALFGVHMLARVLMPKLIDLTDSRATVVVCGVNEIGANLAAHLEGHPYYGVRFVGYFDDRARERLVQIGSNPLLGTFKELGDYARRNHVSRIYMALPMAAQPRIVQMLADLQDCTASIYFVPDVFVTDIFNGRVESLGGLPVVAVRESPFAGVNGIVKRLEDLVLGSLALMAAAPVMLAIAVAIRATSRGPAVFRQRRYGVDGRDIIVYKFRTMTVAEDGANVFQAARKDDQRITPLGRILRKTSLDELPQIINVLQGRMSLVGPRPHAVAMNEQFRKLIPQYMVRHKVRPGITGLAQVRGFRGGDSLEELTKRIDSDLEYLRGWSLGLDLWILAKTVSVALFDKKAF